MTESTHKAPLARPVAGGQALVPEIAPRIDRVVDVDIATLEALADIHFDGIIFRRLAFPGLVLFLVLFMGWDSGREPWRWLVNVLGLFFGLTMNTMIRRRSLRAARRLGLSDEAAASFFDEVLPQALKRRGLWGLWRRDTAREHIVSAVRAQLPSLPAPTDGTDGTD